ncbi:MAG: family transporter [Clostridiales bacterium]|jgi:sporulation integral membrane protein YtvI|nr:family transporter [Clostridiales bacterium]
MNFKITPRRLRILILIIASGLIIYFLYLVKSILPPFIFAIILAYVLNPVIKFIEQHGAKRTYAIIITYLSFILIIFLISFYGFPILLKEMNAFAETIPDYTNQLQEMVRNFYRDFQRVEIPESVRQVTNENIQHLEQLLLDSLDKMVNKIWGVFSSLFSIIIAPILTFYILKDSDHISERILNILPTSFRDEFIELWQSIDWVLTKFIRGHLLVAGLVGLASTIGFTIINMKFAILLGIIAGLADLIPYFGPILGAIPAVALALLNSKWQALYVLIVMFIIQQLESNFLSPKILGESVGLHPLVVIFVLLAGGHLFGVLGMLLAVPVAAVGRITINYVFRKMIS